MGDLLQELEAIVGRAGLLTGADVTSRASGVWRPEPVEACAIVRPASTEEVSAVLRLCHALGQPVVAHGGRTGLVEGHISAPHELVLSLERMTAIEEIDRVGRTMLVQAGAPLETIQEAAEAEGLIFPLDLGARGSCTIGGNISTNAGGNRVIRYGMTRENVLGLEAVLADGTVVSSLNRMLKNNAGYDLKQLFIGTEGTLGVVTRAVLRLREAPLSHDVALVGVGDFDRVTRLLKLVDARLGGALSAFELMWQRFYQVASRVPAARRPPLDPDAHPYYVLVESMGGDQASDSERFEAALAAAMEAELVDDAVLAKSSEERAAIWAIRDNVERCFDFAPLFVYDVSLRIGDMAAYVDAVEQGIRAQRPQAETFWFGHIGDGNLHLLVATGEGDEAARRRVEEAVYRPLAAIGGSISAEHGIGLEKRPWLHLSRTPAEIALMRTLKHCLDPKGILNPGKVLPPE